MNRFKFLLVILIMTYVSTSSVQAKIRRLELTTEDFLPAPRWEFNETTIKAIKGPARDLAKIKQNLLAGEYQQCLRAIDKVQPRVRSLKPWLIVTALKCANAGVAEKKLKSKVLVQRLKNAEVNKTWWFQGGHKEQIIEQYINSHTLLFELFTKRKKSLAWEEFDKLMQFKDYLTRKQKADVLKFAGELAFVQQNLVAAYDYLNRSLKLQRDSDIKNRIKSIRDHLIEKKLLTAKSVNNRKSVNVELESTERENQIYEQMQVALTAGDLVPAVEDGIKLIIEYPSGVRAADAEKKILQIYINIVHKKSKKYEALMGRLFNQMKVVNGRTLLKWGKYLFYKSYHDQAIRFFELAVLKYKADRVLSEVYTYLGQSLVFTGKYNAATTAFAKAVMLGAGTEFSERGMFLQGLSYFRMGELSKSAAQFERVLASRRNSDYELSARYWLWRSLQSLDKERAVEQGRVIFEKFPLTYYGLRARYEIDGSSLDWLKPLDKPVHSLSLQLTDSEYRSWEIAKILLKAGWFTEAQSELKNLPEVYLASSKLVLARIWNLAFNHYEAIKLFNQAWDQKNDLLNLETVKLAFPREYRVYVENYGAKNNIEKDLIWSLIRQESSFRSGVVSSAGAIGLMQLMPVTAKDVARRLRLKTIEVPRDVYKPEINVRMGTAYISQMVRAFDGHLPLALAAYNVGIGNMRKWTRLRPSLEKQSLAHTSNFRNEIWMDELPWDETRHYVKAVLRNLVIYRMLAQDKLNLKEPIW